jgi:hypothetical protein
LALLLAAAGCRQAGQTPGPSSRDNGTNVMAESDFPTIFYAAMGGAPMVDARLSVAADGVATLYVGSSNSLIGPAVDEVGYYSGAIPAEERQLLLELIDNHDLVDRLRDRQSVSPDPVTGYLTLTRDGQSQRMVFAEIDEMPGAVEVTFLLNDWMMALLSSPWRTVQATLRAEPGGARVDVDLELANQGTAPLSLILLSDSMLSQFMKVETRAFPAADEQRVTPLARSSMDREMMESFAQAGLFAKERHDLEPGQPITLALPPLTGLSPGDYEIQTNLFLWIPGEGLEERLVTLRPQAITVTVP